MSVYSRSLFRNQRLMHALVRLEREGHMADGSTYTFEAIATLLGFGAGHVTEIVVLALNVGVLLMMEG